MLARNRFWLISATYAGALLAAVGVAAAQTAPAPVTVRPGVTLPPGFKVLNPGARTQIVRPPSGFDQGPGKAHTNVEMLIPKGGYSAAPAVSPSSAPPQSGYLWQTPASLACAYGLVAVKSGCNPNVVTAVAKGGSKTIAIVDAYDLPAASTDLSKFDAQFGLGGATFTKIYGTGSPSLGCKNGAAPATADGTGWDVEEDIDIEMAHAMAPKAHIYLVEAKSNANTDLFNAEQVAAACVAATGGEVSNSWGEEEFVGEASNDKYLVKSGVVFFFSTGDDTYPGYPATSPNVVAVGGTTLSFNPNTGVYQGQASWAPNPDLYGYSDGNDLFGEGAGSSATEVTPSYQKGVAKIVGKTRGIPDVVAVADPYTGVWVYNVYTCNGWCVYGGTSVATPLVAGITNATGSFFASSNAFLTELYSLGTQGQLSSYYSKMDSGNCGVPTSPSDSTPFNGTYTTWGGGIAPQYQENLGGVLYNECGGWGSPSSTKTLPAVSGPSF